jgi:sensor histidine kinase YesM
MAINTKRKYFNDIYNPIMKYINPPDKQLSKFYLWVGILVFALGVIGTSSYKGPFIYVLLNNIWALIYSVILNFIFFEYTVPFVVKKRTTVIQNILWGILLFFLYMMLCSYGLYAWRGMGIELHIYHPLKEFETRDGEVENMMAYSAMSFFVFLISRHFYTYSKLRHAAQQLRIEKQQAELSYLKSQTNPHFLFNTLNNIYSLARDKSDLAPVSVLRLSKILRFMLYETGGAYIAIEQEIKIISDYIALEKLRYDESLQVNFNCDVEDMKQAIPPLLLIPLVENAFKHGVSETRQRPYVDIHLSLRQHQLNFTVKNSTESFAGEKTVKESIGLANLRRQLELLYTDYSLIVQQGESDFKAVLKINLSSHV